MGKWNESVVVVGLDDLGDRELLGQRLEVVGVAN